MSKNQWSIGGLQGVEKVLFLAAVTCMICGLAPAQKLLPGKDAAVARAKADLAVIKSALLEFRLDCDRYPKTREGLSALRICQPGLETKWHGPYIKPAIPLDPWKHPYVYQATVIKGTPGFTLRSSGPGGKGEAIQVRD